MFRERQVPSSGRAVSAGRGLSAEDHDGDLAVGDAPGVVLVAGVDRPGLAQDSPAFVRVGVPGGRRDGPVAVGDLGARLSPQVVVPGRPARLTEMGADDRDVAAERHAHQGRGAALAAARPGRGDGQDRNPPGGTGQAHLALADPQRKFVDLGKGPGKQPGSGA
jgi:hypothetical protein